MTKKSLVELFEKLEITCNEGIQNMKENNTHPRVVFFEYVWESITASGSKYNTNVTYQVSFFSMEPRNEKLISLVKELSSLNINPTVYHEYLKETREFHSYFSIEVLEDIFS